MIFGTDGIRGIVDKDIDSKLCYNVGKTIALFIKKYDYKKEVFIGYDTRVSADVIVYALSTGLMDYGCNCRVVGILPTAGVSYLCRLHNVIGVMITASHNSSEFNGIKCFNTDGFKLSINEESVIDKLVKSKTLKSDIKGRLQFDSKVKLFYYKYLQSMFQNVSCNGKLIFDVANGVHYNVSKCLLNKLNLSYTVINSKSDGLSINNNCGAVCLNELVSHMGGATYSIGFAFDGDADRLRVVLSDGYILSGDEIIYLFALYLKTKNKLYRNTVVGTIISSKSLEVSLQKQGISFERVDVGDRNVIECMINKGYALGGEESGHICLLEYNTSCDALFNALYLLKVVNYFNKDIKFLLKKYIKLDRCTKNIEVSSILKKEYKSSKLKQKIDNYILNHKDLHIIVRPSGTENVIRIVVEGKKEHFDKTIKDIESLIKSEEK